MRRPIACLLLLASLPACTTWHAREGVSLKELIATEHPNTVRLTRANGSHVVLEQPRVVGSDSLAGVHDGVYSSLAVADVTQIATRKGSPSKTIALTAGASLLAIGALVYLAPCHAHACPDDLSAHHVGGPN